MEWVGIRIRRIAWLDSYLFIYRSHPRYLDSFFTLYLHFLTPPTGWRIARWIGRVQTFNRWDQAPSFCPDGTFLTPGRRHLVPTILSVFKFRTLNSRLDLWWIGPSTHSASPTDGFLTPEVVQTATGSEEANTGSWYPLCRRSALPNSYPDPFFNHSKLQNSKDFWMEQATHFIFHCHQML